MLLRKRLHEIQLLARNLQFPFARSRRESCCSHLIRQPVGSFRREIAWKSAEIEKSRMQKNPESRRASIAFARANLYDVGNGQYYARGSETRVLTPRWVRAPKKQFAKKIRVEHMPEAAFAAGRLSRGALFLARLTQTTRCKRTGQGPLKGAFQWRAFAVN